MITLLGENARFCDGITRRSCLKAGVLGVAGLSLADVLRLRATASEAGRASHRSAVIFVEMAGGPSQFETYDPKPDAPVEYRGAFGVAQTNFSGVVFSEWMPEQARIADKLAVIRSVHHDSNSHDPSSHLTQTGYYKTGFKGSANEMPCFGSVAAKLRGPNVAEMPAYAAVPGIMRNGGAAFLGPACQPFEAVSDPNLPEFHVPNLSKTLSIERLEDRRSLLTALDAHRRTADLDRAPQAIDQFSHQAFELVHGSRAREAFDIGQEPESLRRQYGRNTVGQSLLLARRLVEAGVTCVTVRSTGWDDHDGIADRLKDHAPPFDQGMAALVTDLYDRGMQDDVLVVAMGELGRTPRINGNAGRDHWGALMSVVLAGGGLKTGIIGASNSKGEVPVAARYRPENILAMIYRHLGIDPAITIYDFAGRPRFVLEERQLVRELV